MVTAVQQMRHTYLRQLYLMPAWKGWVTSCTEYDKLFFYYTLFHIIHRTRIKIWKATPGWKSEINVVSQQTMILNAEKYLYIILPSLPVQKNKMVPNIPPSIAGDNVALLDSCLRLALSTTSKYGSSGARGENLCPSRYIFNNTRSSQAFHLENVCM